MSSLRYYNNEQLAKAAFSSDFDALINCLEAGFRAYGQGKVILPEKSSQILDDLTQSRINCMPCTVPALGYSGVKLVSVFPNNVLQGKSNVSGLILLLSAEDGSPIAVFDAGFITALRTALVGGLAARYLAVDEPRTIGLLGAGEEAFMHMVVMAKLFPTLRECKVASRSESSEQRFRIAASEFMPCVGVRCCESDYKAASEHSDIIVTAISGQSPILKADWIEPGVFYCHVGGIEDEYDVALKADKIVCDSWEDLKHRGSPTIAHMYQEGLLTDESIYAELAELSQGAKPGRESLSEFIYFNSIGLAFTDIYVSAFLMDKCNELGLGQNLQSNTFSVFDISQLSMA